MDRDFPIWTIDNECQDCYKCVRHCPVKAIRIEQGRATVLSERCVACGQCVIVCPVHAKQVRLDIGRARLLVERADRVYVSLAPSWVSEYPDTSPQQMCAALRRLGFRAASETAIGAELVSQAVAAELKTRRTGLVLSTACPATVAFVQKYLPAEAEFIWPVVSPMIAHARWLREQFGKNVGVVFIGPCTAKMMEADRHPRDVNVALTFEELRTWLEEEEIVPNRLEPNYDDGFYPFAAHEGTVYPIEGGMLKTLRLDPELEHVQLVALTGLNNIRQHIEGMAALATQNPVFVELLACDGGCINGPGRTSRAHLLADRLAIQQRLNRNARATRISSQVDMMDSDRHAPLQFPRLSGSDMAAALERIDKYRPRDELNCGGCGYDSCRHMARALLDGRAEPGMCVSYMRKRAHRKANALLRSIPAGVVIVDAELRIIECNEMFAHLFGDEAELIYKAQPGLQGAKLEKILPFSSLFARVLRTGRDIHQEHLPAGNMLLSLSLFTIDPGKVVGGIISDVTRSKLRHEQISRRARQVIEKNLGTVQEIACRLGEHMAETEILLREIAEGFASEDPPAAGIPERKRG